MGCASSSPMVQTAGSDMLKAATHVAEDATKTAEEAVQGKYAVGYMEDPTAPVNKFFLYLHKCMVIEIEM